MPLKVVLMAATPLIAVVLRLLGTQNNASIGNISEQLVN
jgi:hypothetical protein